ncbi:MAG: hypothetical protein LC102_07030 [Ignavibacteriales bacterium]|jgi:hypothetical protein|nr:MAG: hypothetical protein F9K26_10825 [Ignavibacteriaceae bacterium]MBW7874063.1 hypothetical protein [Ignavibacteria bacterium]MCZ2143163.1 hypothetical protein [Ignavibacteriales bacterium]MBV6444043.1 hypothetical protein [Ignavibacteriaceae bacterium]MBZ0196106.1 hypothetical protein [Ignavibacteriaceae bacterium]
MEVLFSLLGVWYLALFGAITSIITEASYSIVRGYIRKRWLVMVVALLVTILGDVTTGKLSTSVLSVLLVTSFSILFYTYIGEYTIKKIFEYLRGERRIE